MPSKAFYLNNSGAGFTLIEVMISLTIMSLILTVAFSGLSIGIDSWEHGSKRIDRLDRLATIERLMKRQLALAYPMSFTVNNESFVLFRGTSNHIEFVAAYSLLDGTSDYRKIDYAYDAGHLLYAERYLFDYVPDRNDGFDQKILGEFSRVNFRYLDRDEQENLVWVDEWPTKGLPVAVQVQIEDDFITIPLTYRS